MYILILLFTVSAWSSISLYTDHCTPISSTLQGDTLWILDRSGVSKLKTDGTLLRRYTMIDGITEGDIKNISVNKVGQVFITGTQGIHMLENNNWKYYPSLDSIYLNQYVLKENGDIVFVGVKVRPKESDSKRHMYYTVQFNNQREWSVSPVGTSSEPSNSDLTIKSSYMQELHFGYIDLVGNPDIHTAVFSAITDTLTYYKFGEYKLMIQDRYALGEYVKGVYPAGDDSYWYDVMLDQTSRSLFLSTPDTLIEVIEKIGKYTDVYQGDMGGLYIPYHPAYKDYFLYFDSKGRMHKFSDTYDKIRLKPNVDKNETLYFLISGKLYRHSELQYGGVTIVDKKFELLPYNCRDSNTIIPRLKSPVTEDENGGVWFFNDTFLSRYDGSGWQHFDSLDVKDSILKNVFYFNKNELWFGSTTGNSKSYIFNENNVTIRGLHDDDIYIKDRESNMFSISRSKVDRRMRVRRDSSYLIYDSFLWNKLLLEDIAVDSNNVKWFASRQLISFDDTTWTIYPEYNSSTYFTTEDSSLNREQDENLYIDGNDYLVGRNALWQNFDVSTEVIPYNVKVLHIDKKGTLWAGGLGAPHPILYHYTDSQWFADTLYDLESTDYITEITDDSHGDLWIVANSKIYGYTPDSLINIFADQGHPRLNGYNLLIDSRNQFWFNCSKGDFIYELGGLCTLHPDSKGISSDSAENKIEVWSSAAQVTNEDYATDLSNQNGNLWNTILLIPPFDIVDHQMLKGGELYTVTGEHVKELPPKRSVTYVFRKKATFVK